MFGITWPVAESLHIVGNIKNAVFSHLSWALARERCGNHFTHHLPLAECQQPLEPSLSCKNYRLSLYLREAGFLVNIDVALPTVDMSRAELFIYRDSKGK